MGFLEELKKWYLGGGDPNFNFRDPSGPMTAKGGMAKAAAGQFPGYIPEQATPESALNNPFGPQPFQPKFPTQPGLADEMYQNDLATVVGRGDAKPIADPVEAPTSWTRATIDGKTYDYSNGRSGGAPRLSGGSLENRQGRVAKTPFNTPGVSAMDVKGNTPGARSLKRENFQNTMEDAAMEQDLAFAKMTPQQKADLQARSRAKQDPKLDIITRLLGTPEKQGDDAMQRAVAEFAAKFPNKTPPPEYLEAARQRGMASWQAKADELNLALASGERSMFPQ